MENRAAKKFEIICRQEDQGSNLSHLFANYGCQTLESRIPIVDRGTANQVKNEVRESAQRLGTLALKSEAASNAVDGRIARTKNRKLDLVEVGKDVLIAAGQERDRSPVNLTELDDELEDYMRKVAQIKAKRKQLEEMKDQNRQERERAALIPELQDLSLRTRHEGYLYD